MSSISVVTVVYNGAETIEETIVSVLNQDCKDINYIIIDGGSTDGTIDKIKKYAPRIKVMVSEPDGGIYDAMNKSLNYLMDGYVIYMNSGDKFESDDVVSYVEKCILSNPALPAVIYGGYRCLGSGNNVVNKRVNSKYFFYRETLCHQAVFMHVAALKSIGGFNKKLLINADREALLKLKIKKYSFQKINKTICLWDESGFSSKNLEIMIQEIHKIRKKYFPILYVMHKLLKIIQLAVVNKWPA